MEQPVDEGDVEVDINKESSETEKADNVQVMQYYFNITEDHAWSFSFSVQFQMFLLPIKI